jgi:hypothetical protein
MLDVLEINLPGRRFHDIPLKRQVAKMIFRGNPEGKLCTRAFGA